MRIFPPDLTINDIEGFTPDKDIFKRHELGDGLTNLITSVTDPMVIAVDAEWGRGKTVFLKMWAGELRKRGIPVIYFDAFAHDHIDDAFLSLASEVIALAQEKKADKEPLSNFTAKTLNASKVLAGGAARLAAKAVVRGVTAGTLSAADVEEEISDSVVQDASNFADKEIASLLQTAQKRKDTLEMFRKALSELPSLLADEIQNPQKDEIDSEEITSKQQLKPLVFIIDEFDRCTPPFALSLLERIKHFFSVPNVQFVLGVHLDQLANSVKASYGSEIDAHAYLQKFIHIPVPLMDTPKYADDATARKYVQYLTQSFQFQMENNNLIKMIEEEFIEQAIRHNMSLRTIERIYTTIAIALATLRQEQLAIAPLMVGLAIFKILYPELYRSAKLGNLKYEQVEEVLSFKDRHAESHNQRRDERITDWWRYATDANVNDEIVRYYGQGMRRYNFTSRFDLIPYLTNSVLDKFAPR